MAVVLLFVPLSFGLIPIATGTAVCNGSSVSLDYISFFNSSGNVIPFTIDVLSISGATINFVTCTNGDAIYVLSGSPFTVTFGTPIIGSDSTAYTNVGSTLSFSAGGLTNYQAIFTFTDNTSGVTFGPALIAVATDSPALTETLRCRAAS
jgi:hypothetical protein